MPSINGIRRCRGGFCLERFGRTPAVLGRCFFLVGHFDISSQPFCTDMEPFFLTYAADSSGFLKRGSGEIFGCFFTESSELLMDIFGSAERGTYIRQDIAGTHDAGKFRRVYQPFWLFADSA